MSRPGCATGGYNGIHRGIKKADLRPPFLSRFGCGHASIAFVIANVRASMGFEDKRPLARVAPDALCATDAGEALVNPLALHGGNSLHTEVEDVRCVPACSGPADKRAERISTLFCIFL